MYSIIILKAIYIAVNRVDKLLTIQLDKETQYWINILTRVVTAIKALKTMILALKFWVQVGMKIFLWH